MSLFRREPASAVPPTRGSIRRAGHVIPTPLPDAAQAQRLEWLVLSSLRWGDDHGEREREVLGEAVRTYLATWHPGEEWW